MHLVFVTADGDRVLEEDVDRPHHEAAFARRGVRLDFRSWSDPSTDWEAYDLVVLRSPWDYSERLVEFSAWLDTVGRLRTLQNPAGLVRWNLDKAYLFDLQTSGVPVVSTARAVDERSVLDALAGTGTDEVIVKPAVSAGSRLTGWFRADDEAALELAQRILDEGGEVLVEPFIGSVASSGEVSVVMFDGRVSHSFRKGPILAIGGGFRGGTYQEDVTAHRASDEEMAVVEAAHDTARTIAAQSTWLEAGTPLLYARFDVVRLDDGSIALLEAELFEPSFFLAMSPGAADRFADACIRRVDLLTSSPHISASEEPKSTSST